MKIIKIHIDGFGRLHGFDIEPDGKLTVFFGHNEAGKTTLHLFIRSMFYGASTKKRLGLKSVYERMRPWKNPEEYGGSMEIEFDNARYLIERNFNKAPDDLSVSRITEQGPVPCEEPQQLMDRFLNGLSETAYVNTVSSGQLGAATQRDLAAELRKYASNVSGTMNPDLDADRAIELLQNKKSALEAQIDEEAAKEHNVVLGEIRRIEQELSLPENENQIPQYKDAVSRIRLESDQLYERALGNQEELTETEEKLRERGFSGMEEVSEASESVENAYADYMGLQAKAEGKLPLILAVLFLVGAAGSAAAPWVLQKQDMLLVFVLAAVILLLAAIACLRTHSGRKKAANAARLGAQERLSDYIEFDGADEDRVNLFRVFIEESRQLAAKVAELKDRQQQYAADRERINREYAVCLNDLETQQQTREKVEETLSRLSQLQLRAASLDKKVRDNNKLREEIESVELAEETLTDLASQIRSAAGTYINSAASGMLSEFTDGAYNSINAGVNYDISLNSGDGMISVNDLSAGTADQAYLAIRLATIRFIAGEDDPLPLILDDSFNLYDEQRLTSSLKFLSECYRGQLLIFTCQKREESTLEALGVPYSKAVLT
ncbi:MAG: AAA family ATPase [Lachnospiraceae bacterium]|nr:AAA family ATPase [Lachnospiraceae bacterium]